MGLPLMRLFAAIAAFALACAPAAADAPKEPATAAEWRALALADLDAIHKQLADNSPIAIDRENPEQQNWWREGRDKARALAERAQTKGGYFYALNFYVNGFRDPHVNLNATTGLPAPQWPGFIAAPKGDGAVVSWRADDGPPLGAEIVSCGGETLEALRTERVYPYTLNPKLALDQRRAVSRLFLDRGAPFAPLVQSCLFRIDGREETRTLSWRALPDPDAAYWTAYNAASAGAGAEWGVKEPAPGVFWIGIPTFSSGEQTAPKLKALVEEISAKAETMRSGRAIVVDIRGNGGGNTAWSNRIVEALLPAALLRASTPREGRSAVDWRVSDANIAYWEEFAVEARNEFGEKSEEVKFVAEVLDGLRKAKARGRDLWRQGWPVVSAGGGLTTRRPTSGAGIPARLLVLSNGSCASTCLDFLDRILFVPGVKLIGSDSGGDTNMMEVRSVTLPSGLATLTLPQKVYRGRARGSLEAYRADIAYPGPWDDGAVRAWALRIAEGAP